MTLNKILHAIAVFAAAPAVLSAVSVLHLPPFVGLLLGASPGQRPTLPNHPSITPNNLRARAGRLPVSDHNYGDKDDDPTVPGTPESILANATLRFFEGARHIGIAVPLCSDLQATRDAILHAASQSTSASSARAASASRPWWNSTAARNSAIAGAAVAALIGLCVVAFSGCATTAAVGTIAKTCEPSTDQESAILAAASSSGDQAAGADRNRCARVPPVRHAARRR